MVGNSATRLACEFQRTEGAVISANMKRRQGGKSTQGPLFRGLAGRSATGRNDQAAAEEMWLRELGAGCRKNIPAVPAGRSVFHLTSPLIGLLAHVDYFRIGDPESPATGNGGTIVVRLQPHAETSGNK